MREKLQNTQNKKKLLSAIKEKRQVTFNNRFSIAIIGHETME